jgi:predicted GIY-YIG superfamily endonuclease
MKSYCVYILTNDRCTVLYVGVTNDLDKRMAEHCSRRGSLFVWRYNVFSLAYAEQFARVGDAIAREKQIKGWTRAKKIALIESANPAWRDIRAGEPSRSFQSMTGLSSRRGPEPAPRSFGPSRLRMTGHGNGAPRRAAACASLVWRGRTPVFICAP